MRDRDYKGDAARRPLNSAFSHLLKPRPTLNAAFVALSLAMIEPALGRLKKLGDTLTAKQYLFIAPSGEVAYFFPHLREIPISRLALASFLVFFTGVLPGLRRLAREKHDALSRSGAVVVALGAALLVSEYVMKKELVILRRIGLRYLAMATIAVGSFLMTRDRKYLSTLGICGFTWDISSAIFWSALNKSLRANVPVGWYHHFDEKQGSGVPCWLVIIVDLAGLAAFISLRFSKNNPLGIFLDE